MKHFVFILIKTNPTIASIEARLVIVDEALKPERSTPKTGNTITNHSANKITFFVLTFINLQGLNKYNLCLFYHHISSEDEPQVSVSWS